MATLVLTFLSISLYRSTSTALKWWTRPFQQGSSKRCTPNLQSSRQVSPFTSWGRSNIPLRPPAPPPPNEYSHDGPIRRRKREYILTTDQSDAGTLFMRIYAGLIYGLVRICGRVPRPMAGSPTFKQLRERCEGWT
eukprot:1182034-Prorocentrum_minimum.AAC.1